jgi:hypothetical protein
MPDDLEDLFPSSLPRARTKRRTMAPEALTPPQLKRLEDWAERRVPWLKREALDSFENLESYVEEILDWWRGEGGLKADWLATVRNRIEVMERRRLAKLATDGNEAARQALRHPEAWAVAYDSRRRIVEAATTVVGLEGDTLKPKGAQVIRLAPRSRRR